MSHMSSPIPRNKWVKAEIMIDSKGKIKAKIPAGAVSKKSNPSGTLEHTYKATKGRRVEVYANHSTLTYDVWFIDETGYPRLLSRSPGLSAAKTIAQRFAVKSSRY